MVDPVDRQLKRMIKQWEYELNHGTPFENYFGKNHWTKRLQTKNWNVDITWRSTFDEEYFDIYASRPGTSSVDYSTFIKPDFEEEEATTVKSYQKHIADLLELYDDSMFEELIQYIEGTYYEHPEDREE